MADETQLAIAINPEQQGAIEVRQQVNQIQYLMKQVLKAGEHYGNIPGTKGKPTLFQSGAEKIAYMFHLVPSYQVVKTDLGNGHREYEITCTLTSRDTGEVMGYGVGTCTTLESKYRYRNQWSNGQKVKVVNPDIADTWNTVLKMAKKRAFVDAVKSTTAASDIFTQDVEDLPDYMFQRQAQPVAAQVAPPQPTGYDTQRMAKLVEKAVELGYDREKVRGDIWECFKSGGMSAVQQWAAAITGQEPVSDSKPEFSPEGGEAALSPDDIEF